MSFFEVEKLSISFGGLDALSDLSFEVQEGQIYSIIGPNGAGKTTLFNCIHGIYRLDRGSIFFKDREIQGIRPDEIAKMGIARTFQDPKLFAHMSTMDNLMLGRHKFMKTGLFRGAFIWGRRSFAGQEEIANRKKAEEVIEFLNLQSVRDKSVGDLPFGARKQVELARALALEPQLLLLDEPFAGMNLKEAQDMVFRIKEIRDTLGITVLLIEHDMKMVMDISDRVLAMNFGGPIVEGIPEEVRRHPEVSKAYLGEVNVSGRLA